MFTVGILTVSDKGSRGEREDLSGPVIRELISKIGGEVRQYDIVPDEKEIIAKRLKEWADVLRLDLILTTGGTGLTPRDVTPEATREVIERPALGFSEAMRQEGLKKTPLSMLSRGISGVRARTLIINLPGSPRGVRESLEVILPALPHAIETLRGEAAECARDE